jgi:hypothetical protein
MICGFGLIEDFVASPGEAILRLDAEAPFAWRIARREAYPKTEVDHGETVSVQNPYRQPHAPSRNADAELRVRSAIVGGCRQAARLPDIGLCLQDCGGRTGLLRLRIWPARAPRGNGCRLGLFAVQPSQQRDRRGQAFRRSRLATAVVSSAINIANPPSPTTATEGRSG